MTFADRLRDLRQDHDMQQTQLAEMLNLKSSAISKYEKNITQPSIDTLIKLSHIFDVTIDYLVGISDEEKPHAINISPFESNIILRFRKLNYENQIRIDERINLLLEAQN